MSFNDLWNSIDHLASLITVANWGIAATLFLAFVCTVVVIKAGNRKDELVGSREQKEKKDTADAQKAAAEAQLKLDQWLAGKTLDRRAQQEDFAALKRFKNMNADILYKEDDGEAYVYAGTIHAWLLDAGWSVSPVTPTRHNPVAGAQGTPIIHTWVLAKHTPHMGEVFKQSFPPPVGVSDSEKWAISLLSRAVRGGWLESPAIPENKFIIVVGQNLREYHFGEQ